MNDDHHYGARPISLGTFAGHNKPSDIMHANRGETWRDTTWFLVACCILTFGWMGWSSL